MTCRLRQIARTVSLFEFVGQFARQWQHVPGTGARELAALWWRMHR